MSKQAYNTTVGHPESIRPVDEESSLRPVYVFVIAMIAAYACLEFFRRAMHDMGNIDAATRDFIGIFSYLPLLLAATRLHLFLSGAKLIRNLVLTAIVFFLIAQVSDFMEEFEWGWRNDLLIVRVFTDSTTDALFSAIASAMVVGAVYFALIDAELGKRQLHRDRLQLESETAERRIAVTELQAIHAELEERVEDRTRELLDSNLRLEEQILLLETAREELDASRKLLGEIERISNCGAWAIDTQTEVLQCTDVFRRIFGFSDGLPIHSSLVSSRFTKDALPLVLDTYRRALKHGEGWELELPFVRMDGARRWMRTRGLPTPITDGYPKTITGTVQDITAERNAMSNEGTTHSLFEAVVRTVPVLVWAIDLKGTITLSVGAGLRKLGLEPGSAVGLNLFKQYPNDALVTNLARKALSGASCSDLVEASGFKYQTTYTPLFDSEGRLSGSIGVALDITEQQFVESRRRQKQKLESLGVLAGGIAHDFNNILYAMDGFAALASKEVPEHSTAGECLAELRYSVKRAASLVERILAFSRREEPTFQVVDLCEEIRKTIWQLSKTSPENIQLHADLPGHSLSLVGDEAYIQRILVNLCNNGIYAMRNTGGMLRIAARRLEAPPAHAGIASPSLNGYVECEVTDSGTGIEPRLKERLFEPFFSTKPPRDGTGLGLAIVHSLVTSLRGAIQVESDVGEGTTFRFYIPAASMPLESDPTEATPIQISGDVTGPSRNIYVVDDEPQVRHLMRLLLGDAGHQVTEFASAEEILKVIDSDNPPDLILADLTMPDMDGQELIRKIRMRGMLVPAILSTGHVEALNRAEKNSDGISAILKKPLEPAALLELVAHLTRRIEESSTV